ncbi:MAG: TonB-dependent receptor [Proteobacteria bacterium]|nr:TonB-dependent receptor [Pseudomonadota bacterium]
MITRIFPTLTCNDDLLRPRFSILFVLIFVILFIGPVSPTWAEQTDAVHDIGEVQVRAQGDQKDIRLSPVETVIRVDDMNRAGTVQNVTDLVLTLPMFDNRGASDLVPDVDSLYMRGFDSTRFSTAIDGMTLRKTGGRKSSNIVDYGLLPPWLFGEIQVLPGPYSAVYPAKSIGGVLNLIPKAPEQRDSLIPETRIDFSIESYGTVNQSISTRGSAGQVTYDFGYQNYRTDGYLRHTSADIGTFFSRIGYLLPADGFVTFSFSHTDTDKDTTVINDPDNPDSGYDPGYPVVAETTFYDYQEPTWDSTADSYRLIFKQPSWLGTWSAQAYYSEESRDYHYLTWVNTSDHSLGKTDASAFETTWTQQGGKIEDALNLGQNHILTIGTDLEQCFDDGTPDKDKEKRIEVMGAYVQDSWAIVPGLSLKTGLRYEDVAIRISNIAKSGHYITGRGDWIDRDWNEVLPKSFLTFELDHLSESFRDTSISAGVSKVWRAPDYHGDYNPHGRPAGAWIEPEHGYGCDLVLTRRLFSDIILKLDYGFYEIKDYIATNSAFAQYTPSAANPVTPGLEYMDYKVNLEKVVQHSVDIQMNGHLLETLSFYLGYAFLDMSSKGGEPAGEIACDQRARHRINGGLTYSLFSRTKLILDYTFQDHQIIEVSEEVGDDVWMFTQTPMDNWQTVDMAVQQVLFDHLGPIGKGTVKVYVKNLFDETYVNSSGYPATDRRYGASLNLMF